MATFSDLQALDISLSLLGSMIEHEEIVRVQESRDRAVSHQAELLETITGQLGHLNSSVKGFVDTFREAREHMTDFMQVQTKINVDMKKPKKTVRIYSPPPPPPATEFVIPFAPSPIKILFNSDAQDVYNIIVH